MKRIELRNGAVVELAHEPASHDAPYVVTVWAPSGARYDRRRCDTYRGALEYYRAFVKVAKVL